MRQFVKNQTVATWRKSLKQDNTHVLKIHLIESIPYFRYLMMGIGLLLIMRYRPKGILPEKIEIK